MAGTSCGDCRFFIEERQRDVDSVGTCKLGKKMGLFSSRKDGCSSFSRPGDDRLPQATERRRSPRASRVPKTTVPTYLPRISAADLDMLLGEDGMSKEGISRLLKLVRTEMTPIDSGTDDQLKLVPRDSGLQSKDIPLDQLFHKLFMMHGNLRVLEQKLLGHELLDATARFQIVSRVCRTKDSLLAIARPEFLQVNDGDSALELIHEIEWTNLVFGQPVLGEKWRGGVAMYSGTSQEPVEKLFHRLCVARDQLLQTEACIDDLFGARTTEMQNLLGYVKRCAGTLKTFNLLFADRDDYFKT